MPRIGPPPNIEKVFPEPVKPATVSAQKAEYDRIQRFLDCPNWTCYMQDCLALNFGRNKNCAHCFGRMGGRITPRPLNYIEPPL
jgi:hypothetical protein